MSWRKEHADRLDRMTELAPLAAGTRINREPMAYWVTRAIPVDLTRGGECECKAGRDAPPGV